MKKDLKEILFIRCFAALEAYQAAMSARFPSKEAQIRQEQFRAIWGIIEEARLEDEFEIWKEG